MIQLKLCLLRPFDENEIDLCITKLKRDKAIGIDNIMNEYILMSKHLIKPVLWKLFNLLSLFSKYLYLCLAKLRPSLFSFDLFLLKLSIAI
jgi:hypothetical protein